MLNSVMNEVKMNIDHAKYVYLYVDPGHYGRFSNDENRVLERYHADTVKWVVERNVRLIKRFNEDSEQITHQDFLHRAKGKTPS